MAPAALAQSADLVGAWEVERVVDTAAEPAPDGGLSALFPDNPYTFAPLRLHIEASGDAVVTLLAARHDGYEILDVPSTVTLDDGQLAISLDDLVIDLEAEREGDRLVLRGQDGSVLTLRRQS
ncbi:hypothetical protein [Rubrivirga sp. IMCC43871]|uniref:hypothetical protein n=1 Tax=Rubrivirga sp. IMCC43871 TaxID=3391575 RepID=UPI00398F911D